MYELSMWRATPELTASLGAAWLRAAAAPQPALRRLQPADLPWHRPGCSQLSAACPALGCRLPSAACTALGCRLLSAACTALGHCLRCPRPPTAERRLHCPCPLVRACAGGGPAGAGQVRLWRRGLLPGDQEEHVWWACCAAGAGPCSSPARVNAPGPLQAGASATARACAGPRWGASAERRRARSTATHAALACRRRANACMCPLHCPCSHPAARHPLPPPPPHLPTYPPSLPPHRCACTRTTHAHCTQTSCSCPSTSRSVWSCRTCGPACSTPSERERHAAR